MICLFKSRLASPLLLLPLFLFQTFPPKVEAGEVFVNEVGDKGTYLVCGGDTTETGEDYIELINTADVDTELEGYILHDDKGAEDEDAYTFPAGTIIGAGEILLLCKDTDFDFGIGSEDMVSLVDTSGEEISTTGMLMDLGSDVLSYQRTDDGMYEYAAPTPGEENSFDDPIVEGPVFVNEVGDKGTYLVCGGDTTETGEEYIELINTADVDIDLEGYILHDDKGAEDDDAYTFPAGTIIGAGEILLLCKDTDFDFGIGGEDMVSLVDTSGEEISTTGMLMDLGSDVLSYQRTDDGMYEYAAPTPGNPNFCSEGMDDVIVGLLSIENDVFVTCGDLADNPQFKPIVCLFDPYLVAEEYSPAVVCPNTCGNLTATEVPSDPIMGLLSGTNVQRASCLQLSLASPSIKDIACNLDLSIWIGYTPSIVCCETCTGF